MLAWAHGGESRYVCVVIIHMVMEVYDDPGFRAAVNSADLVARDGMPFVRMASLLGVRSQQRVYGPDLTLHACRAAARESVPVGLFGGRPDALAALVRNLEARFPGLQVAYAEALASGP